MLSIYDYINVDLCEYFVHIDSINQIIYKWLANITNMFMIKFSSLSQLIFH